MSYVRLNTVNTDGWPVLAGYAALDTHYAQGWPVPAVEFARASLGRYANVPAGLRGLGQDDFVGPLYEQAHPEDEQAWYDMLGMLQAGHADLLAMEAEFRRNPAALDGRELIALRNEYTNLASQFQYFYTLLFGAPAPGLGDQAAGYTGGGALSNWWENLKQAVGLGALPLAIIGGAVVAAALFAAIGVWFQSVMNTTERLRQSAQLQSAMLQSADEDDAAADAAEAQGDVARADQLRASANAKRQQAGLPAGPQEFMQWFQSNWQWLAVGTAAIVALPTLLKKI